MRIVSIALLLLTLGLAAGFLFTPHTAQEPPVTNDDGTPMPSPKPF